MMKNVQKLTTSTLLKRFAIPRIRGYELKKSVIKSKHIQYKPTILIEENENDYVVDGTVIYSEDVPIKLKLIYRNATVIGSLSNEYLYRQLTINNDNQYTFENYDEE